jgi:hypothetical protein
VYAEGGPESGAELPVGIARLPLGNLSPWFCVTRLMEGYLPSSSLGRCRVLVLMVDDTERIDMLSEALRGDNDVLDAWCLRLAAWRRLGECAPNSRLISRLELEALSCCGAGVMLTPTACGGGPEAGRAREGCWSKGFDWDWEMSVGEVAYEAVDEPEVRALPRDLPLSPRVPLPEKVAVKKLDMAACER